MSKRKSSVPVESSSNKSRKMYSGVLNVRRIIEAVHSEFKEAVVQDNEASVLKYLEMGVNPNIPVTDNGKTPLMIYAERGNLGIVKELLANGAGIHFQEKIRIYSMKRGYSTELGYSALMFAAKHGHLNIVKELLAKGANVNFQENGYGFSVLMVAAEYGRLDIVKELLAKGADVNLKNKNGYSAAMVAAQYKFPEIGIILIENGTNVVYTDDDEKDRSLLTVAVENYYYCDRNSEKEKRTKFVEFIQRIVEKGADVNEIDRQEDLSPLMYASSDGSLPIVEFLIEKGANVNVTNKHGNDALSCAISDFEQHGWEPELYTDGWENGNPRARDAEEWFRIFEILVDNADDMYKVYSYEPTQFTFLSYLFSAEATAVEYIEEYYDDITPQLRQDQPGMILLDLPIEERKKRVSLLVKKMIDKGVNVSFKDDKGQTAGDHALKTIYKEIGVKLKEIEAAMQDFYF